MDYIQEKLQIVCKCLRKYKNDIEMGWNKAFDSIFKKSQIIEISDQFGDYEQQEVDFEIIGKNIG